MNTYRAELHVHTVLSPCADVEMIPPLIVESALESGITLIAITDHNASANVKAVQKAAANTPLTVLPGIELQTAEEVHCLCLFDNLEHLETFQSFVTDSLPQIQNRPEHFGEQYVVDETGEFVRSEDRLLIVSTALSMTRAFDLVESLGGLFIPAHVNRKAFGLIENLGFVPTDIPIEVLEISRHLQVDQVEVQFPQLHGYPIIRSGDVHRLDEFLGANMFLIESPTIPEMKMAIRNLGGRTLTVT